MQRNGAQRHITAIRDSDRTMTLEIPAIAVFHDGRRVTAGRLGRNTCGTADYLEFVSGPESGIDRKSPILAVDVRGMAEGGFRADVVKNVKIKRYKVWLMTCIKDADDLFDVFNSEADTILVPYHLTTDEDLEDMHSVSESIIPAVICSKSIAPEQESPEAITKKLVSIGFDSAAVFDLDGRMSIWEWERLSGIAEILPYSENVRVHADRRFTTPL